MAIELRQQLKLTQQLVMTPQLQMAIKLLQLSRLELMDAISHELEENPTLEEVQDRTDSESKTAPDNEAPEPASDDPAPTQEITIEERISEDMDWSSFIDEYNTPGRAQFEIERRETPNFEAFLSKKESLYDHLLWQLRMSHPSEEGLRIGNVIIGSLNRDGYLETTLDELVLMTGSSREKVTESLALTQTFDPVGVCAMNLTECLLIQMRHLGIDNPHVSAMATDYLNHLENKNYKAIARALKVGVDEIAAAASIIQSLEPKPGRQFSNEEPQYITPDIYVYRQDRDFVIVLNDDGLPKLRVSSFYKQAIQRGQKTPDTTKDYIQEKLRSAAWLIRSIHQRQKTIYRVMESILKFQRGFFEKGVAHLKPMVLRDVAEDIGMHESTISRVTTNKYAHTPQGIFELKYFFNSSINRTHGGTIASASVQQKIREIIDSEDPRKPYSDDKISAILKNVNIDIARRTVAKYREMMVVLPSNKRKRI